MVLLYQASLTMGGGGGEVGRQEYTSNEMDWGRFKGKIGLVMKQ